MKKWSNEYGLFRIRYPEVTSIVAAGGRARRGVALEAGGVLLSARLSAILSTPSPLLTEPRHTCN